MARSADIFRGCGIRLCGDISSRFSLDADLGDRMNAVNQMGWPLAPEILYDSTVTLRSGGLGARRTGQRHARAQAGGTIEALERRRSANLSHATDVKWAYTWRRGGVDRRTGGPVQIRRESPLSPHRTLDCDRTGDTRDRPEIPQGPLSRKAKSNLSTNRSPVNKKSKISPGNLPRKRHTNERIKLDTSRKDTNPKCQHTSTHACHRAASRQPRYIRPQVRTTAVQIGLSIDRSPLPPPLTRSAQSLSSACAP